MINKLSLFFVGLLVFFVFQQEKTLSALFDKTNIFYPVTADSETAPVPSSGDAADDIAVWVNQESPEKSLIIGTDKQRGIAVYDLKGHERNYYDAGRINNVDVRCGFPLVGSVIDIVAGTNRTDDTIVIFKIIPETGELENIAAEKIKCRMKRVYGFCLYHSSRTDNFYAFVVGKSGELEQWKLYADQRDKIAAKLVRSFDVGDISEGLAADDQNGLLYVAEEDKGIWRYSAEPDGGESRTLVDDFSNPNLKADIEGLTIFYAPDGKGYLIASSQGNDSFAVYTRDKSNKYLGSFKIHQGDICDGAQDTDGIDVTGSFLGKIYPHGLFIVQDGFNTDDGKRINQNFKYVSWKKIAEAFQPSLIIPAKKIILKHYSFSPNGIPRKTH